MATEKAAWVDLRLPGKAHAQIKAWGARLGVSAEGMARMLLLMRVHEMMGEDLTADDIAPQPEHDADGSASLAMWQARLNSIGLASDDLPAPCAVNGDTRIYKADDFTWPEGPTPLWGFAHVTANGEIGVSKRADG